MKLYRPSRWLTLGCYLLIAATLAAITIVDVKVKCPVCGAVNDFHAYASWGSYVYSWPSKFQMVFWPHTYSSSLYICRECHYAAWMWDFKNLKPENVAKVQKAVSGISFRLA